MSVKCYNCGFSEAAHADPSKEFDLENYPCPSFTTADEVINQLRKQVEALKADKKRLDWLDRNFTYIADSERYLTKSVYWGDGSHHSIRSAVDRALAQQGGAQDG